MKIENLMSYVHCNEYSIDIQPRRKPLKGITALSFSFDYTDVTVETECMACFLNGPSEASFYLFLVFKKNMTMLTKNVHPVYGAGIQTHNL